MGARATIAAGYGLTGVLNALWGATLPATDARLDLGAGRLGGLLMALALGALAAMPVAGWLAGRWSEGRLLRLVLPTASVALVGPALAPSFGPLVVAAVVLGVLSGALNVALSLRAVAVERELGRPVMAAMHGTWTLGAVAGGALVAGGLRTGTDVRVLMAVGAAALALAGVAVTGSAVTTPTGPGPAARPDGGTPDDRRPGPAHPPPPAPITPAGSRRPGLVFALGVVGAAAFVTEGAATDWAGVHATRVLGAAPATASLMYTVFFVAMTGVRFVGDALRARLGAATTVRWAGGTAGAGYALVLLAGTLPVAGAVGCALAGWALAGAGMAMVWPVVTSTLGASGGTAGRLSAVTTISYGGGLVGPALIGYAASRANLPTALLIPAALALLVAVVAPSALARATNPPRPPEPAARTGVRVPGTERADRHPRTSRREISVGGVDPTGPRSSSLRTKPPPSPVRTT
ncbi:MFS transporter [Longispora urticae]